MKKLRLIFVFSFLLGLAVLIIGFNTTKPRLLVLQSYDKDYALSLIHISEPTRPY